MFCLTHEPQGLKFSPTLEDVKSLVSSKAGNCIPVFTSLPSDILTPIAAYLRLTDGCTNGVCLSCLFSFVLADLFLDGRGSFLLESVVGGSYVGRYSFVGASKISPLHPFIFNLLTVSHLQIRTRS
jgi:anthranilate synthase component 1